MPPDTKICYRVRPFPSLGVYRRGHNTFIGSKKTCINNKTCEIWFVNKGEAVNQTDPSGEVFPHGSIFIFSRTVDIDKVPLRITPDGEIFGCSLGEILEEMDDEAVLSWSPDRREILVPLSVTDPELCKRIISIFQQVRKRNHSTDPMRFLKNRIDITVFLVLLTEHCRDTAKARRKIESSSAKNYCDLACAYVQKHLSSPISVSDAAAEIGISYNYLRRIFSQHMVMSPIEYINREKMRLAAQLSRDFGYNLSEIGEAVGIQDTKYLSRLFHKHMGMSVTQYKKLCQQEMRQP